MKTDAKAWTPNTARITMPSKSYQTLCERQSGASAVQASPDCVNTGQKRSGRQINNSDARFYCAKINRVSIPVSGGRHQAIIDEADYPLVSSCAWYEFYAGSTRKIVYAQNGDGVLMHRLIAGARPGDGTKIDHRDGNGLNNTRENLRIGSQSQNLANQRLRTGTQSGFKGVRPIGDKWAAEVRRREKPGDKKPKRYYLGLFDTKEEAAAAYNAKALELYGPFARLNPLPCPIEQEAAA